ncbi:helix-turn-helix domain-containing protein [Lysinibacillus pakistanensis]|uniref:Helix-turn-helix domain-containing protein n=2 Tax=Lysinibacillus pakistanensis TaxID=759811 RepID=A0ABX6D9W1_9BACI|nr:helix-turn-helix domain-containing protein [Lysinibacillus pakistanensis]
MGMAIGDKMKALRESKGWTQKHTAEKMDVSPQMYNNYEKNKTNPSLEILKRVCDLYNIDLNTLDDEYSQGVSTGGKTIMEESFRHYQVIETKDMSAEQLQEVLSKATNDFPEKQIDYVVGTKIILGYESILNKKGRAEAKLNTFSRDITINSCTRARI